MSWLEALEQVISENRRLPPLDPRQRDGLVRHAELLTRWNQVHNLTRLEAPMDVARRHWADSLLGLAVIESSLPTVGSRVLDVGSGAGFPGVPAALLWPSRELVLVEAARKRASFLQRVARELSLTHLTVLNSRQEDIEPGRADLVVTRATLPWERLPELSALIAPGGWLAAWVSAEPGHETWQERLLGTDLTDAGRAEYQVAGSPPRSILYARRRA